MSPRKELLAWLKSERPKYRMRAHLALEATR